MLWFALVNAHYRGDGGCDQAIVTMDDNEARTVALVAKVSAMREEQERLRGDLEALRTKTNEDRTRLKCLEDDIVASSDLSRERGDRELLEELRRTLETGEELKLKEKAFKSECRKKISEMRDRNASLRERLQQQQQEEQLPADAETELSAAREKLDLLRRRVSEGGRRVIALERTVDEQGAPGSHELAQYQARFLELDGQMVGEYSQTQQFYSMFNTLQSQSAFMSREVRMLDSLLEGLAVLPIASFSSSAAAAEARGHFLKQLETLTKEAGTSLTTAKKGLSRDEECRAEASRALAEMVETQRKYAGMVRELRDELKTNSVLQAKLKGAK